MRGTETQNRDDTKRLETGYITIVRKVQVRFKASVRALSWSVAISQEKTMQAALQHTRAETR